MSTDATCSCQAQRCPYCEPVCPCCGRRLPVWPVQSWPYPWWPQPSYWPPVTTPWPNPTITWTVTDTNGSVVQQGSHVCMPGVFVPAGAGPAPDPGPGEYVETAGLEDYLKPKSD